MSIKYNGKIVAGNYKAQVVSDSDTVNKGIIRIATQEEVNNELDNTTAITPYHLSRKQNKLIVGKNINIDNDIIECEIIADNETIIQDENKNLTAIGQKTKSNTIKIDWEGTTAEYEAGIENGTIKPNWYCYITDDEQIVDFNNTITKYDLESLYIYTLGDNIMIDEEGYSVLESEYLDKNSVSKIDTLIDDNFIRIGLPIISDNGILIETSNNNYIYADNLNFDNKQFNIHAEVCLKQDVENANIFYAKSKSRENHIECNIENNEIFIKCVNNENELISEKLLLDINVDYYLQVGYTFEKNQIYLKIFNKDNVLIKMSGVQLNEYNLFFGEDDITINIGNGLNGYLNGLELDLSTFRIYLLDKCIYRACLKIPYIYSPQKSKIVDFKYKNRVESWIEANGISEYYLINTVDKSFILPYLKNVLSTTLDSASKYLDNLTEEAEKHFVNKTQITNCILEVPQRIKYTLENGVLTIKAGSVVIVPYGTEDKTSEFLVGTEFINNNFKVYDTQFKDDKFFVWAEFINDTILITDNNSDNHTVFINLDSNTLRYFSRFASGDVDPAFGTWGAWYDTASNTQKLYNTDGLEGIGSFPILNITMTEGIINSIDQVFNGIGYIGSTIWVDKDVKGLIPNGRNEDGSLNNIQFVSTEIKLLNATSSSFMFSINPYEGGLKHYYINYVYKQDTPPNVTTHCFWLDTLNNQWKFHTPNSTVWKDFYPLELGNSILTNGVITSLYPKQTFTAVDYSEYKPALESKVSKAGDIMTGSLNIQSTGAGLRYLDNNFDLTVIPETEKYSAFMIGDKHGTRLGQLECSQTTAGARTTSINTMFTASDGSKKYCSVITGFDADGNAYTATVTPSAGDNSTKIATTAYCVAMRCTTKATKTSSASTTRPCWVVQNYKSGTSWYRVWSDGWIEQGGITAYSSNRATVTFLKKFSDTNYTVTTTDTTRTNANSDTGGAGNSPFTIAYTTSNFIISQASESTRCTNWYACGY